MLRPLIIACALALPAAAAAEQFPRSALNAPVRSDDGTVIGAVAAVERNADGEIVAVEIPGLEPADAPRAPPDLIVEEGRAGAVIPVRRDARERRPGERARRAGA